MNTTTASFRGSRLPKSFLGRARKFSENAMRVSAPSPVDRSVAELQIIADRRREQTSVAA